MSRWHVVKDDTHPEPLMVFVSDAIESYKDRKRNEHLFYIHEPFTVNEVTYRLTGYDSGIMIRGSSNLRIKLIPA